jgi:hypothetical protein
MPKLRLAAIIVLIIGSALAAGALTSLHADAMVYENALAETRWSLFPPPSFPAVDQTRPHAPQPVRFGGLYPHAVGIRSEHSYWQRAMQLTLDGPSDNIIDHIAGIEDYALDRAA